MIELSDREAVVIANKLSAFVRLIQGMNCPIHSDDVEMLLEAEVAETNILIENLRKCAKV